MLLDHKVQGENHNIETTRPPIVQLLDISSSMIVACVEDANSTGSTDQSTKLSFERQTCDHRILPQRVWNIYGCSRADGRRGVRRTTAGQLAAALGRPALGVPAARGGEAKAEAHRGLCRGNLAHTRRDDSGLPGCGSSEGGAAGGWEEEEDERRRRNLC
ncbi:unnamed protein product [Prorocentrum cordatum]|uniref:Uncharacterized protein n=1 Tax=Prorocentrum cordatum TaxID=2364126 RepID=A0ABN9Q5R5_9DINO|nr:unnamed protein product [Polarella glacialis]